MIALRSPQGGNTEAPGRRPGNGRFSLLLPGLAPLMAPLLGLVLSVSPALPQGLPACKEPADQEFRVVPLATGSELMQMDFDPDGRIFFATKKGEVRLLVPATRENRLLATLPVASAGYMGLLSLALDPRFPDRPWIYLFYNPANGTVFPDFRLSRFSFDGQKLDLASEMRILDVPNKDNRQTPEGTHTGGKLAFGTDGLLYLTTGDNSQWGDFSVLDDRTPETTPLFTSGNTNHLGGKVLRIRLNDNATYDIPPGNLFPPGLAKTRPEIYAMGLRNPYSIHLDPRTGWMLIGEVGSDGPAATSPRGPGGGDEFLVLKQPANFGWPMFAGPNLPYARYDAETRVVGAYFDPAHPVNESRWNTGLRELPPARPSVFNFYKYNPDTLAVRMGFRDRAMVCIAGPRFRYRSPSPVAAVPPSLHGRWIVADHVMNRIGLLDLDSAGEKVRTGRPFLANQSWRNILDLRMGPDGALHVLEMYGRISRIEYTGPAVTPAQCGLPMGCTRTGYLQYNPKAEVDDGSCRTPVALRPDRAPEGAGPGREGMRLVAGGIAFLADGGHAVELRRLDGRGGVADGAKLRGNGPARYRFADHVPRGLYLLTASSRGGNMRRKVAVW